MPRLGRRPRTPERQLDLFPANHAPKPCPSPEWIALPDQARHALTVLMTRLLITHANGGVPDLGGGGDEH